MITIERLNEIAKENKIHLDCLWVRTTEMMIKDKKTTNVQFGYRLTNSDNESKDFFSDTINFTEEYFESDILSSFNNSTTQVTEISDNEKKLIRDQRTRSDKMVSLVDNFTYVKKMDDARCEELLKDLSTDKDVPVEKRKVVQIHNPKRIPKKRKLLNINHSTQKKKSPKIGIRPRTLKKSMIKHHITRDFVSKLK